MSFIVSVDVREGRSLVARAFLTPEGAPRLERVDGTEDDLRFIQTEAFGADNIIPLDAHAFFSQLAAAFPADLASAFGAYVAIPSFDP